MDESSNASVSSFYEPPEEYDEDKTRALYQQLSKNLQDVNELLRTTNRSLRPIKREAMITAQIIDKIQSANKESDEKDNEKEDTQESDE